MGWWRRGVPWCCCTSITPAVPDNAWRAEYEAALAQATGSAERQVWRQPGWVRNEGVLLDSAFCDLHRVGVLERRRTQGATLVDRALIDVQ